MEKRSTTLPAGMPRTTLTSPETSMTAPHCRTLSPMTSLALTTQKELTREAKKTHADTSSERVQSLRGASLNTARTLRYDSATSPGILLSDRSRVLGFSTVSLRNLSLKNATAAAMKNPAR